MDPFFGVLGPAESGRFWASRPRTAAAVQPGGPGIPAFRSSGKCPKPVWPQRRLFKQGARGVEPCLNEGLSLAHPYYAGLFPVVLRVCFASSCLLGKGEGRLSECQSCQL